MRKGYFILLLFTTICSSPAFGLDPVKDKKLLELSLERGVDPFVLEDVLKDIGATMNASDAECGGKRYYQICRDCCEHRHHPIWNPGRYKECLLQCSGKPKLGQGVQIP
jgi:hypothetical protein